MKGDIKMAKKVGFIGLGMMGNPMSSNLINAGFELTVWNRTESKMKPIVDLGAKPAKSAKEVAENSEVVITMLTGPADVEEVILGNNGVLEGAQPGAVIIDMSTNAPAVSQKVAAEVASKGFTMLDAPVSGSIGVAKKGALTIQVGGDKQAFEANQDVFSGMGANIFHIGANGMGCFVKLVGNSIMGTNVAVLAEAMCIGAKAGVPTDVMLEVLKNTGAASKMLDIRGPNIVSGDYSAQFMLKLLYKDLGLALDTASENSVPLPIISLVRQIYGQAMVDGRGDDDMVAVAGTTEKLSGVNLKN